MESKRSKFTPKEKAFIEHYLNSYPQWNGTEAARLAGYRASKRTTLASIASENLTKPHIQAEIQRRLDEMVMRSNEVLRRLGEQARANIAELIEFKDVTVYEGKGDNQTSYEIRMPTINEEALAKYGHLVKKIRANRYGVDIELHDPQTALVHIGRHHKLFTDTVDVNANVNKGPYTDEQIGKLAGAILAGTASNSPPGT